MAAIPAHGGNDPLWSTTQTILDHVNEVHGFSFKLSRRLYGGFGSETYTIAGDNGNQAVLKWDRRPHWINNVRKAAPVVAQARAAGWPTPEWLAYGAAPCGSSYVVQEFIDLKAGSHKHISGALAKEVVDFLEHQQAGVHLDTEENWSAKDRSAVFESIDEYANPLRRHSKEGADLVELIEAWVVPFKTTELKPNDLVHGDFQPGNFLLASKEGCRIAAVVDVEAVGKGSRFHDAADLLGHSIIWQGEKTVLHVLNTYAKAQARPGEWEISVAARFYELLYFYVFKFKGSDARERLSDAAAAIKFIQNN